MAGSKVLDAAEKGSFCGFFSRNGYSCSIYPALDIFKIKWSFFKTTGDHDAAFDIYMEVPTFIDLLDAIMDPTENGLLARIIAEGTPQYPGAWKSGPMGPNGANQVIIGASQKGGITLQGRTNKDGKSLNAFIPIASYADLKDLARIGDAVLRLYGEKDDVPGITGWYKYRALLILLHMEANSKNMRQYRVPQGGQTPLPEVPEVPGTPQTPAEETVSVGDLIPFDRGKDGDGKFAFTVTSPVKRNGQHQYFEGNANGEAGLLLVFNENTIAGLGQKWQQLTDAAESGKHVTLSVRGMRKGNQILFMETA